MTALEKLVKSTKLEKCYDFKREIEYLKEKKPLIWSYSYSLEEKAKSLFVKSLLKDLNEILTEQLTSCGFNMIAPELANKTLEGLESYLMKLNHIEYDFDLIYDNLRIATEKHQLLDVSFHILENQGLTFLEESLGNSKLNDILYLLKYVALEEENNSKHIPDNRIVVLDQKSITTFLKRNLLITNDNPSQPKSFIEINQNLFELENFQSRHGNDLVEALKTFDKNHFQVVQTSVKNLYTEISGEVEEERKKYIVTGNKQKLDELSNLQNELNNVLKRINIYRTFENGVYRMSKKFDRQNG